MTINKSQGLTFRHVCVFLPSPVSSNRQLYVAMSRVGQASGQHVPHPALYTGNVVYTEVFDACCRH
ncbi:hypothetical protein [Neoaquamicrobium sediminum]|uniref:hypothetical protein n=1 Tax=Neoaquamicrobium sediminum TaxID=1849104 RepID=UPI0040356D22